MPDRLAAAIIARIEHALRNTGPQSSVRFIQQLAYDFDTITQTIYCYKRRIMANQPPKPSSGGTRHIITWKIEQAIKHLLEKEPW
jgi:hypothetical protein